MRRYWRSLSDTEKAALVIAVIWVGVAVIGMGIDFLNGWSLE